MTFPYAMDEHGDLISNRGFRHTLPINGVEGYGGTVRVYESSGAAAPRVWLQVTEEGDVNEGTIHLEVADARRLAENILRVCDLHYQLREEEGHG